MKYLIKNINPFIVTVLIAVVFFGCEDAKEDDDVFSTPIGERVNVQLKHYIETLQSAPQGWKLSYQPNAEALEHNIYLQFNPDLSLEIISDINAGEVDLPTTYRVSKSQLPELVIESYSAFHFLFEANQFELKGEFEFNFISVQPDEIVLKSKTDADGIQSTTLTLTPANIEDKERIKNFQTYVKALENDFSPPYCFRVFKVVDANNQILFDGSFVGDKGLRTGTVCYLDNNNEQQNIELAFDLTEQGLTLVEPFIFDEKEIQSFNFNAQSNSFTSNDGGYTTIISYEESPSSNSCIVLSTLFSEPFTSMIPTDWDTVNASFPIGTDFFRWTNDYGGTTTSSYNAASGSLGSQVSNWLISPVIELKNNDVIGFWVLGANQNTYADRMEVRLSTNGENSILPQLNDSQDVGDFQTVLLDLNPNETTNTFPTQWTWTTVNISNLTTSPVSSRIAFRHRISDAYINGNLIWVDQITHFSNICE